MQEVAVHRLFLSRQLTAGGPLLKQMTYINLLVLAELARCPHPRDTLDTRLTQHLLYTVGGSRYNSGMNAYLSTTFMCHVMRNSVCGTWPWPHQSYLLAVWP